MYQGKTKNQLESSIVAGSIATIGLVLTMFLLWVTELIKAYLLLSPVS